MPRSRLGLLAGVLLLAACGSGSTAEKQTRTVARGTLQALAQGPGQTVAITPGDADFAPGPLRYTFLVIAHDGRVVSRPRATVWIARGLQDKPFFKTSAMLEPIGVPGVSKAAPDPALYRWSVAQSLAARVPFVLTWTSSRDPCPSASCRPRFGAN